MSHGGSCPDTLLSPLVRSVPNEVAGRRVSGHGINATVCCRGIGHADPLGGHPHGLGWRYHVSSIRRERELGIHTVVAVSGKVALRNNLIVVGGFLVHPTLRGYNQRVLDAPGRGSARYQWLVITSLEKASRAEERILGPSQVFSLIRALGRGRVHQLVNLSQVVCPCLGISGELDVPQEE